MQKRHGQLKEHSIGRPQGAPQTVPMETAERRNVEFAVEGGVTLSCWLFVGRRARLGREGCPRVCSQILYRRRQLGFGG
jgi:hypothetical protein